MTDPSGLCGQSGQPPCPPTPTPSSTPTAPVTTVSAGTALPTVTSTPPAIVAYDPCFDYPQLPCTKHQIRNEHAAGADGYVLGYGVLKTDFGGTDAERIRLKLWSKCCKKDISYNATVEGVEAVYDFVHMQKAVFTYQGLVLMTSVGAQGFAYEGFTFGFANQSSKGIQAYGGFFVAVNASLGLPIETLSAGATYAFPVTANLEETPGVEAVTAGGSLGVTLGVSNLFGFNADASYSITYYDMKPDTFIDFKRVSRYNRDEAAKRMIEDMHQYAGFSPGLKGITNNASGFSFVWGNNYKPK